MNARALLSAATVLVFGSCALAVTPRIEIIASGFTLPHEGRLAVSGDGSTVMVPDGCFLWRDGVIVDLPLPAGGTQWEETWGISRDGSVVVGWGTANGEEQAWRWENGITTLLGDLPGGESMSKARAVSADGRVIVGSSSSSSGTYEAFRWENGSMTGLGYLGADFYLSQAWGVSDDGSVIVGRSKRDAGTEGFRWEDGVMTSLDDPAVDVQPVGGVSADGSVIVGLANLGGYQQAFRWEDGVISGLGHLGVGPPWSGALDVSADGSLVVGMGSLLNDAFVWTGETGMVLLKDYLVGKYGLDLAGWDLTIASGISDDGTVMVGYGKAPGRSETVSWIVHVPEPTTFLLLMLGVLRLRSLGCVQRSRA